METQSDQVDKPASACPVCGSPHPVVLVTLPELPVHCNVLFPSREEALGVRKAPIELVRCRNCTHVFNSLFDPGLVDYRSAYENSLFHSPTFRAYAKEQALKLIARRSLQNGTIVEIGAGDGRFLALLCELGNNRGIAFDPSRSAGDGTLPDSIELIADYYDERYAHYRPDLVCCRQVLEHVWEPLAFLESIKRPLSAQVPTAVFFEVPNGGSILEEGRVWDVIYEHYSYFTARSLKRAFERSGFGVTSVEETFGRQYLCLDGSTNQSSNGVGDSLGPTQHETGDENLLQKKLSDWVARVEDMRRSGRRVTVWGAGSKGVTFLNLVRAGDLVDSVIDVNPRKRGMFVAGTGHKIDTPEALKDRVPEVVLVANALYQSEIEATLKGFGISAELACL